MWPFRLPDPPEGFNDEALAVQTIVEPERGQWVVYVEVTFWDSIQRHRIGVYRTERLATIAADIIRRTADRDLPRPPMGA